MTDALISVVILTYNRPGLLAKNLEMLHQHRQELREVIVVDNSSEDDTQTLIADRFPNVTYLRNEVNTGVAGRNRGIGEATGDILVTLDDDVMGLTRQDFQSISRRFRLQPKLGALCFRVLHYQSGEICNWCHHREHEKDGLNSFLTYEISEGAVAYRRDALLQSGLYFEDFFISHEGKDLAFRLMNQGFEVAYDGSISVTHCHAVSGRANWRRYYFDTRNSIWLAVRNMPFWYGFRFLALALTAMGFYSLRDGFPQYWFKAVRDGLRELPKIRKGRTPWTGETLALVREIDRLRPGFWYKIKARLFRRRVEI